jgi:hypothetical protein
MCLLFAVSRNIRDLCRSIFFTPPIGVWFSRDFRQPTVNLSAAFGGQRAGLKAVAKESG